MKEVPITIEEVDKRFVQLRGQLVLIDKDIADLYGVETKRINEAVKNNPQKFPDGYVFSLQIAERQQLVESFDRFKTLKHSTSIHAFTEKALYMLATILKSPKATETTIAIIETYAKVREVSRNLSALQIEQDGQMQKSLLEKTGDLLSEFIDTDSNVTGSESTIEVNLMAIKFKHTVKRSK